MNQIDHNEHDEGQGGEAYGAITENEFLSALKSPLSTFSIDVDTASYSNLRRFLTDGILPPAGAVRIEELINYFPYDYAAPRSAQQPFSSNVAVFPSPFTAGRKLGAFLMQA